MRANVVGYIRTATTEEGGEENYLKRQEADIKDYCQQNNYNLLGTYSDIGFTGTKVKERKGFQRMLSDIVHAKEVYGTEVNYVMIENLSRLSRSMKNLNDTLNFLQEENVSLISISDGIDTSTEMGKTFMLMTKTFYELEQEFITSKKRTNKKGANSL